MWKEIIGVFMLYLLFFLNFLLEEEKIQLVFLLRMVGLYNKLFKNIP